MRGGVDSILRSEVYDVLLRFQKFVRKLRSDGSNNREPWDVSVE